MNLKKKTTSKKALIVCSTGKGSAKILFQRIKNTIPELEILGISSVFELEYNPEILKIADLVISTVYFKTEDKPFIKVSPFVSGSDISKIKSFIYEGKGNILNREAQQEENVLRTFMEIIGKYVAKDKIEKVKQDLNNDIDSIFKNFTPVSNENELYERYSEKTAMSVIEMGEMLNEMYENNIVDSKDKNLFAIVIHIIMAIPRWRIGDYAEEIDIEKYKNQNPEMFKIIKRRLNYISEKYNFNVPETEAVSLMRYLI